MSVPSSPVPRTWIALATVGLAILIGCSSPTEAQNDNPPPMESGITTLLDDWTASWASMNGAGYASHYSVDADFVNPLGHVLPNRAAIAETHNFLFGGPFAGSVQRWQLRRLVPLSDDLALVDLNLELEGFQGTPPGLLVSPDGIVRTRARMTIGWNGSQWEIRSQQLTAYAP